MNTERELILIGTYTEPILFGTGEIMQGKGEGICLVSLDVNSGALTPEKAFGDIRNPSFLCRHSRFLYAVNELKEYCGKATGSVSAFEILEEDGLPSLKFLGSQPSGGTDPCHVAADAQNGNVYVSNFMSGSVSVFPTTANGELMECSCFLQHEGHGADPRRQAGPHAHSLVFDNEQKRAFVPDLGIDKLMVYNVDHAASQLHYETALTAMPGDGPRFCVFHSNGRYCYLINELASGVSVLEYHGESGEMTERQRVSTLPDDFDKANICADIHLSPDGRFLFASNRGHDSIATFRVEQDGAHLTLLRHVSCGGKTPRNFALSSSGKYLLVANQDSDTLISFHINEEDGSLQHADTLPIFTPVCVLPLGFH